MLDAQALYGPDAGDIRSSADGSFALGRRLARLLPEDRFDGQPLTGGGGRFLLVADLRLDDRAELAAALGIAHDRLARMADSDLLLAAYEEWREECCARLVGDFAFALWDEAERSLLLARDFMGARPLHYHDAPDLFAFASMPKGLHALDEIARAPDLEMAAAGMTYRAGPSPRTLFARVERVMPGHMVVVKGRTVSQLRHWRPAPVALGLKTPGEYGEALREQLDRAVASRLRGAANVGAQLSAGLDSAAVTASAATLLAPPGRVTAFTAVPRRGYCGPPRDPRLVDEGPLAAATAARYPNVDHILIDAASRSPFADLDRSAWLLDQPAANLCNMPWLNRINDAARAAGLKVLLTGQAGNAGFSYDGMQLLPQLLGRGRLARLAREMLALRREGVLGLERSLAHALLPNLPPRVEAALLGWRGVLRAPRASGHGWGDRAFEQRLRFFDRYDPGNVNKGQLGGWGLDWRDPTADRRLIEFTLSVPEDQFLRRGVPRALARSSLDGRVPQAVLDERRKGLQAADWHEGAEADRARLLEEIAAIERCEPVARLIDAARLRSLAEQWPAGGWERREVNRAYRVGLLRALSLGHFLRTAHGKSKGPPREACP